MLAKMKKSDTTEIGKDVDRQGYLHSAGGNVNQCKPFGKQDGAICNFEHLHILLAQQFF